MLCFIQTGREARTCAKLSEPTLVNTCSIKKCSIKWIKAGNNLSKSHWNHSETAVYWILSRNVKQDQIFRDNTAQRLVIQTWSVFLTKEENVLSSRFSKLTICLIFLVIYLCTCHKSLQKLLFLSIFLKPWTRCSMGVVIDQNEISEWVDKKLVHWLFHTLDFKRLNYKQQILFILGFLAFQASTVQRTSCNLNKRMPIAVIELKYN